MHHIRSNTDSRGRRVILRLFMLCCFMFFMMAQGFADTAEQRVSLAVEDSSVSEPIVSAPENEPLKIYFFNPEINASRNLVLKNTWDTFLSEQGKFTFQPVDRQEDFKHLLENQQGAAFIMAEWLFNKLEHKSRNAFNLALQGMKDGQDTYKRILVSNSKLLDLDRARIACSGDRARNLKILSDMFPELSAHQIDQLKLLQVPKDIDALMALGYGLADLALSSEVGLSNMAMLNENRFRALNVIKESKPLGQSILVFKDMEPAKQAAVVHSLLNMPETALGRQAINLIGLDNWKVLDTRLSSMINQVKDGVSDSGENASQKLFQALSDDKESDDKESNDKGSDDKGSDDKEFDDKEFDDKGGRN